MAHVSRPRVADEADVAILLMRKEGTTAGLDGPPEAHDADLGESAEKVSSQPSVASQHRVPARLRKTTSLLDPLRHLRRGELYLALKVSQKTCRLGGQQLGHGHWSDVPLAHPQASDVVAGQMLRLQFVLVSGSEDLPEGPLAVHRFAGRVPKKSIRS